MRSIVYIFRRLSQCTVMLVDTTVWSYRIFSKRSRRHNRSIRPPSIDSKVRTEHAHDAKCFSYIFTVVVIHEADALSRDAQSALRRTMEKYMGNLRLVLCATSTSRIIAPIRSRCLLMRVAAPNHEEVRRVLVSCRRADVPCR